MSNRITIVDKPDYKIQFEYDTNFIALHLPEVVKFTKDVYMDMKITLEDLNRFAEVFCKSQLFVAIETTNRLVKKLITKNGFQKLGMHGPLEVYVYNKEGEGT